MIIAQYKNFTVLEQTPVGEFYEPFANISGILFLGDESGVEWYDLATNVAPEQYPDMYFLLVSPKGQALQITQDATSLFPSNASVFVLDSNPFEGTEIQDWEFDGKKFVQTYKLQSELVIHAVETQLGWVASQIAAYSSEPTAQDYLNALIEYRSALVSLDPAKSSIESLPEIPVFQR